MENTIPVYTRTFREDFSDMDARAYDGLPSDVEKEYRRGPNKDAFIKRLDEIAGQPAQPRQSVRGTESAAPAEFGFDPAFDESPSDVAPKASAPAPAPVSTTPAAETRTRLVYEYQPRDPKTGAALGGLQKFYYYDPARSDLVPQLANAHSHATAALRSRRVEQVIEEARSIAPPTPFQEPKLIDPASNPNAEAINELTINAMKNGISSALNVFAQRHPDYIKSDASAAALCRFVHQAGLSPSDSVSWDRAWDALKNVLQPEQVAVATVATVAAEPAPAPRARAANAAPIATGLSSADLTSDHQEPIRPVQLAVKNGQRFIIDGKAQILDVNAWDRLPSETMRRALKNPANANAANILYAQQEQEASARRSRR